MNTLNLGSDEIPATKKKSNTRNLKIALGLAAVILVPTIGTTLAGSITVGTGSVEFGQGQATTAACGNLTLTPAADFDNATGGTGVFELGTVTLSAIPSSCSGKTFTIRAWGATSDTPIDLSTRTGDALIITPTIASASSCTVVVPSTPATANETATCSAALSVGTAIITVVTVVAADDIYKFTVESA